MIKRKVAIIGSGNIGTDLLYKIHKLSDSLAVELFVGIDPNSDGLGKARDLGVRTTHEGVDGLIADEAFPEIAAIFDATSADAHIANVKRLGDYPGFILDLTPAAVGPFVVPPVNLEENLSARNLNMVTCGGQATIPIVAAIGGVSKVHYGEIVASISSRSAGPGTRANIDEFTETTANAIEKVGGATVGKAIIILNPAEPPMVMRDTVMCIVDSDADRDAITLAVERMVNEVSEYVPGYILAKPVHFRHIPADHPDNDLVQSAPKADRIVVTALLEVTGASHYLPAYAGNLDIMTSAAMRTAEKALERAAQS